MEWIFQFWNELVKLTIEMAPYLMLGFLFAGILYAWFPNEKMVKYLGKNNSASVFNAALLGVPLPLCSCGVIPTGVSFYRNGASKGSAVAFLISTPQTGVDSIMVTWSLLGWPFAILRPIIALVTGMLGGMLTNFSVNRENKKNPPEQVVPIENENKKVSLFGMLRYAYVDFLKDIVKWLTIGLLIAALMAVVIPEDFFLRYLSNDYLSMLIILIASVPLYVCATGSVPIAAVLMMKGLSPGAALVFLMAGPATNAATISVIGNTMGRKTMFTYLFSIISGALFFGILVNEFLPRDLFMNAMNHIHTGGHQHEILPHWLQVGSAIILTALMINGLLRIYFQKLFRKKTQIVKSLKTENMNYKTILVEGMTCNHCKMTVENNLKKISGVSDVKVDLVSGKVILEGDNLSIPDAAKTINELGYKFRGEV
jgi:uncharacterized membrane protein YraQ (UPF0718 family)/copper chaperone CopZ